MGTVLTNQGEFAVSTGNELARQTKENLNKVAALDKKEDELRKAQEKEQYRLKYDVYEPKIRILEQERNEAMGQSKATYDEAIAVINNEIVALRVVPRQVERILKFLRLDVSKDLTVSPDELKSQDTHAYKEFLGYVIDDDYLKVMLLILENRKPKNKYSLVAQGRCLFHGELLELPRHYIDGFYTTGAFYFSLELAIHDFPTVDEAKKWAQKPLLQPLLAEYQSVKSEYLDILSRYKVADFQELLVAVCPDCGYFYSEFDPLPREKDLTCSRCNFLMLVHKKKEGLNASR